LKLFDCSHCGLNGNIQFEFFEYIAIEKKWEIDQIGKYCLFRSWS